MGFAISHDEELGHPFTLPTESINQSIKFLWSQHLCQSKWQISRAELCDNASLSAQTPNSSGSKLCQFWMKTEISTWVQFPQIWVHFIDTDCLAPWNDICLLPSRTAIVVEAIVVWIELVCQTQQQTNWTVLQTQWCHSCWRRLGSWLGTAIAVPE